jgi:hypothetical protein
MKRFTIFLGLAVFFLAPAVLADVPKLINFQGILRDGSGNPVTDGFYTVRFRIHDDSTAGTSLWEETVPVQTTGGLFSVRLGDATALPNTIFSSGANRFVGVKVNADTLAPRTRLISVPYAFHALRSDSAATATVALDLTCTGCVGTSDIDATQVQRRVTGTAPVGEYITAINQDGSVATAADQGATPSGWTDDGAAVRLTDGTDKVGIGTATPASQPGLEGTRLEIADANGLNSDVSLRVSGGGATGSAGLNFAKSRGTLSSPTTVQSGDLLGNILFLGHDGTDFGSIAAWIQASVDGTPGADDMPGRLEFKTTADGSAVPTTQMTITSAGQVGIGTSAPQSNLHIFQDINSSVGLRIDNPNVGGAAQERIDFGGSGASNISVFGASNRMSIVNNRTSGAVEFEVGGTQRLFISNGGNVGIGTNGPNKKLEVVGSVKADTVFSNVLSSNSPLSLQAPAGTSRMYIDDVTGSVGIGTTSLSGTLTIYRSTFPSLSFDDAGATVWGFTLDGSSLNMNTGGSTKTRFLASGNVHFGITGGNVGIGTESPLTRLHVEASGADVATFNRATNDGIIVRLDQAGITEGTISVAGTTVSYNAFTGSHYGRTEEAIERGELVSLTGVNQNSHDNPKSEIIYGIRRSNVPNDPACLGSYLALSESSKPYSSENPHLIMAVGNGDMWVVDEGQNIQPGDYLISSSTPGHAMRDDEAKYPIGHIVARAAEGVDWATVNEMVGGRKHRKISVLFGNFVRSNPSTMAKTLEYIQEIIQNQQKEILELKKAVLKNGMSVMADTKR